MDRWIKPLPTCHVHVEGAAVAAVLVGGHKHHLSNVSTPHLEQLQHVLVVIWHCHLIQAGLAGQDSSPPAEKCLYCKPGLICYR